MIHEVKRRTSDPWARGTQLLFHPLRPPTPSGAEVPPPQPDAAAAVPAPEVEESPSPEPGPAIKVDVAEMRSRKCLVGEGCRS